MIVKDAETGGKVESAKKNGVKVRYCLQLAGGSMYDENYVN